MEYLNPSQVQALVTKGKAFVVDNLKECLQDYRNWSATGVIPNGCKLRELADMLKPLDNATGGTMLAAQLIALAAIHFTYDALSKE